MDDIVVLVPCTFFSAFTFIAIVVAIWAIVDRIEQKEETEHIHKILDEYYSYNKEDKDE